MKRIWKRVIPAIAVLVCLLVAMPVTFAQPPGPEEEKRMKEFMKMLDEELRETIKGIMEQHKEKMQSMHQEMKGLMDELGQLIIADADQSELDAKIEEIGEMHTEMLRLQVETQIQIRNMLTEEQKEVFDQMPMKMGPGPMHQKENY